MAAEKVCVRGALAGADFLCGEEIPPRAKVRQELRRVPNPGPSLCVCVCVYVLKATDEAQHQSFSRSLADAPIFANQADTPAATCSRRLS